MHSAVLFALLSIVSARPNGISAGTNGNPRFNNVPTTGLASEEPLVLVDCVKVGGCERDYYLKAWTVYRSQVWFRSSTNPNTIEGRGCTEAQYRARLTNEYEGTTAQSLLNAGLDPKTSEILEFTEICLGVSSFTTKGVPFINGKFLFYNMQLAPPPSPSDPSPRKLYGLYMEKVWKRKGEVVAASVRQPFMHGFNPEVEYKPERAVWVRPGIRLTTTQRNQIMSEYQ